VITKPQVKSDQLEQQAKKQGPEEEKILLADSVISSNSSSSSDEEFALPHSTSPTSMRLYLPKPRAPIQRRFTLSGPPRPSPQSEQFWRRLQLERSWRSNQNNSQADGDKEKTLTTELRDKSFSEGTSIIVALRKTYHTTAASDARNIIQLNKVSVNKNY